MSKIKVFVCFLVAACCADATNIAVNMTVDNAFNTYISTSDAVQGTLIGSGNNWPSAVNFSSALTGGVTNYIHIVAVNQGGPGMFLGDFTLSDAAFRFGNGTQLLVSNTTGWGFNSTGFGNAYSTPTDEGGQGTSPWGSFGSINAGARYIWNNPSCDLCTLYFSAAITPQSVGAVPEPATLGLLGGGLALVLLRRSRRVR